MKINKFTKSLIAVSALSFLALPALASNFVSPGCKLGSTCEVSTHYDLIPQNGTKYECKLTHMYGDNALRVWVHSGKNFVITSGAGFYSIDPNDSNFPVTTVKIEGKFTKSSDKVQIGQIRFRRVSGDGTVSCKPVA